MKKIKKALLFISMWVSIVSVKSQIPNYNWAIKFGTDNFHSLYPQHLTNPEIYTVLGFFKAPLISIQAQLQAILFQMVGMISIFKNLILRVILFGPNNLAVYITTMAPILKFKVMEMLLLPEILKELWILILV